MLKKLVFTKPQKIEVPEYFDTWTSKEQSDYLSDCVGALDWVFDVFMNLKEGK